jgi:hypothetical protein
LEDYLGEAATPVSSVYAGTACHGGQSRPFLLDHRQIVKPRRDHESFGVYQWVRAEIFESSRTLAEGVSEHGARHGQAGSPPRPLGVFLDSLMEQRFSSWGIAMHPRSVAGQDEAARLVWVEGGEYSAPTKSALLKEVGERNRCIDVAFVSNDRRTLRITVDSDGVRPCQTESGESILVCKGGQPEAALCGTSTGQREQH